MIARAPFARAVIKLEVARKISNTTQVAFRSLRSFRASNSAGEKRTSALFIFLPSDPGSHVVKKILLRVPGVRTKISLREFQQALRAWPSSRKIKLSQRLQNPDIDWKSLLEVVAKQQYTICDLTTDSRQAHQLRACALNIKFSQRRKIKLARRNHLRRGSQVGGPKAHFASAQFLF